MLMYSALLTLALSGWTLRYLLPILRTAEGREDLTARFGRNAAALAAVVAGKRAIWVQAVSVGEVLTATRLIAELQTALGDRWCIVVSTTTRTGQALAKEKFGAERVFYMPLDFAFAVRAYLRVLQPKAIILIESEVWPRMMYEARKAAVPVVVVNARVSDRSFRRSRKFRWLWSRVLRQSTQWLAQSEEDARRLVELGARPGSVTNVGNLKYDIRAPKQSRMAELIREAANGRPIVVAGSTVASTERGVDAEEAQVIYGWMKGALPSNALLVLAPRHPERFQEVWEMVFDFPALRATDLLAGKRRNNAVQRQHPDGNSLETIDIVLLDTIGDLATVYGIADVAYVGGSMMQRGGHNPLEPAQFGVPVVMGSSFENFRDIVEAMKRQSAIKIIRDEIELEHAFDELLTHPEEAKALGQRGRAVFESQQGATARTVTAIFSMIESGIESGAPRLDSETWASSKSDGSAQ
jgi:3-deoxy-D-manno-octulosonic-acid transferase